MYMCVMGATIISHPDSFGLGTRLSNCMHRYLNAAPFRGLIKVLHSKSSSLGMMHKLSSYLQNKDHCSGHSCLQHAFLHQ